MPLNRASFQAFLVVILRELQTSTRSEIQGRCLHPPVMTALGWILPDGASERTFEKVHLSPPAGMLDSPSGAPGAHLGDTCMYGTSD